MTLKQALPILTAIDCGEPWQFNAFGNWNTAWTDHCPLKFLSDGFEIRLKPQAPKPEKWAAEKAAHKEGKPIEWRVKNVVFQSPWKVIDNPSWGEQGFDEYRIAPTPTYIPLGPEDVPPGSVFRRDCWPVGCYWTPTAITEEGPIFFNLRLPENPLWSSMAKGSWQILRPNSTVWEECRREAK